MFDLYFCPRKAAQLRAGPDASWLLSLLEELHQIGYARHTIRSYLREAELFGRWLRRRRRPLASLTDADVLAFATRRPLRHLRCNARSAGNHVLRHLRDRGLVPATPSPAPARIEQVIAAFDKHMLNAAGLAANTRLYRQRYAREFLLSVFGTGPIKWTQVQIKHVRAFISTYGQTDRTAAAQVAAGSLRSFLRWLQFRGLINSQLPGAVPLFRRWRLAALPHVLTDHQLAALIATFDRSTSVGRRDFAMAVCMVDLGLRVGEIEELELDDVDIAGRNICLRSGKPRRQRVVPMTNRVNEAVVDYIRRDRPTTTDRHVFVRHRLPTGIGVGVSRELIRGVIRRAYAAVVPLPIMLAA